MKQFKRKFMSMKSGVEKIRLFAPIVVLVVILTLSIPGVPAGLAQESSPVIWQVQVWEGDRTGLSNPVGIAFSSRANAFEILEGTAASTGELVKLTHVADPAGVTRLTAAVRNPINMAYDPAVGRLLLFQVESGQLLELREGPDGTLDPATLTRHDVRSWGVRDPQGISVDQTGTVFILDAAGPKIVRLQPGARGDLDSASASSINLNLASPRGIAYDPTSGHLYVMAPAEKNLYELSQTGDLLGIRNLVPFDLKNPQGMTFAPSGDQTDDPAQMSLFLADGATAESTGQIVELSLVAPATLPAGTTLFPASQVRTFNTSSWNNPSPDPGGIDYWPATGQFLLPDSEIEESVSGNPPAYWKGYNVFISTLSGSQAGNCTTFKSGTTSLIYNNFSKEPTGVAINETNNHIFYSDDDAHKIFEVSLGADGKYCTSDDVVTSVSTSTFGAGDSEDVAYGNNTLFIAGGTDGEVYKFSLGSNGVIGGGDDGAMTHFDTAALGFHDLEGIDYRQDTGTLYIVSTQGSENYLGEVSTSGNLLQAYSLSFMGTTSNLRSDVVYAPASQNQSARNIYIVSRGVDNNTNRLENDGKVWEISISNPSPTATRTPTNTPGTGSSPTPTPTPTVTATSSSADLIFADSFEAGDFSAWTANVTDSGNLSVSSAAALKGSRGMQALLDDNNVMYVRDDSPSAEPRYRVRFYFDPNSISMVSGDSQYIFNGFAGTSTAVIRGAFRYYSGAYQVNFGLLNDSGTWQDIPWQAISDAPHVLEIDWIGATGAGANNGGLTFWIDGTQKGLLTGVDNDTRRIDSMRLGAVYGVDSGTRGTYYFDAFESRRQSYIGP
ncbi:MAG: hypothetical protein ACM3XO_26250 [Bacteroidota bacterium]